MRRIHPDLKLNIPLTFRQLEVAIAQYQGDDPLEPWIEYICWIEQTYPKSGKESALDEVLIKCIQAFENDERYRQDRRMVKVYMKYIDGQSNPQEFYQELYNQGVGTMVADLYIGWAHYYDEIDNFKMTEAIFKKGLGARAQPLADLEHAHKQFGFTMSQRILYKDEPDSQEEIRASLVERRTALTSLRAHRVGTVRTGDVVRSHNPGIVNQENLPHNARHGAVGGGVGNIAVQVFSEEQEPAPRNESIVKTLVDTARARENTHEPGPWNKAKLGKSGPLFGATSTQLSFNIAVDEEGFTPIPYSVKTFDRGFQRPKGFVARNEPQSTAWSCPVVVLDPTDVKALPMYPKPYLYPKPDQEYSAEELRAYKWLKRRNVTNRFTQDRDGVWSDSFECGSRLPPGFARKNLPHPKVKDEAAPEPVRVEPNTAMKCRLYAMHPSGGEELSTEELQAVSWRKNPKQRLFTYEHEASSDVEMDVGDDAMEETFIGNRRVSIHPLKLAAVRDSLAPERRSVLPRKSELPAPAAAASPVLPEPSPKVEHQFVEPLAVPKKVPKPRDSFLLIRQKLRAPSAPLRTVAEKDDEPPIVQPNPETATAGGAIMQSILKRRMEQAGDDTQRSKNKCTSE